MITYLSLILYFLSLQAQAGISDVIEFKLHDELSISFQKPKGAKGKKKEYQIVYSEKVAVLRPKETQVPIPGPNHGVDCVVEFFQNKTDSEFIDKDIEAKFPGTRFVEGGRLSLESNLLTPFSIRRSLETSELFLYSIRGGQNDIDISYYLLKEKMGIVRVQSTNLFFDWEKANIKWIHSSADKTGAICVGPNLSKVSSEKDSQIFLQIDDLPRFDFKKNFTNIISRGLSLDKNYNLTVSKAGEKLASLQFSFNKFQTNHLVIWRGAGSWQIAPVGSEKCEWPTPNCPKGYGCK